jgi:hypothetical protein
MLQRSARCLLVALLISFVGGNAYAVTTGTMNISAPNSVDGAEASLWGMYHNGTHWVTDTFGTGTIDNGYADVDYTIPIDNWNGLYWNALVDYSPNREERTQWGTDAYGAWFQQGKPFDVTVKTYMFDQLSVTANNASFRASANNATVFPNTSRTIGSVSAYVPWTGAFSNYPAAYNDLEKWGLLETKANNLGYFIEVLEEDGDFRNLRLHNSDDSYSVDLFGKWTSDGSGGNLYFVSLVADKTADLMGQGNGIFEGNFDSPLTPGTMCFLLPRIYEFDTNNTDGTFNMISGMGATDVLVSGAQFQPVPEPMTMLALGSACAGLGGYIRRRRRA